MIKFGLIRNHKHFAWDKMGSLFWKLGEEKIKPSPAMLAEYLKDTTPTSRICIIGASTFSLIQQAIDHGLDVTVIDFSEKMCADLEESLAPKKCRILLLDVLGKLPDELKGMFSHVLSDRLINRFSMTETKKLLKNASLLLQPAGELRTTIRMGLYDLDKKMIAYQEQHPQQQKIYDKKNNTINFDYAKEALTEIGPENGRIPKNILLEWYLNRGIETRYTEELIEAIFLTSEGASHGHFEILHKSPTPDQTPSLYYKLTYQCAE